MLSNGFDNTVGVNLIHRPILRFTFSGRRITLFAPARLVDSWSSQAVEFSAAITRCSRVHIQIVTVWASMMGDIFSLPATDTLRAFSFHCTLCLSRSLSLSLSLSIYIYIYIRGWAEKFIWWRHIYCWLFFDQRNPSTATSKEVVSEAQGDYVKKINLVWSDYMRVKCSSD